MLRKIFSSTRQKQVIATEDWGFDQSYYLRNNPDVTISGDDPCRHYMNYGWRELRDPSDYFSTTGYLQANPDVATAQINPLQHFREYGLAEGRTGWQKRRPEDWSTLAATELHALQKQVTELRHLLSTPRNDDMGPAAPAARRLTHMTPRAAKIFNQFSKIAPSTSLG